MTLVVLILAPGDDNAGISGVTRVSRVASGIVAGIGDGIRATNAQHKTAQDCARLHVPTPLLPPLQPHPPTNQHVPFCVYTSVYVTI
eukprot:gene798-4086_t